MPLHKEITTDSFKIGIWRIEENISFFAEHIKLYPAIENESKKLQWYATRHLINQLIGHPVMVENNSLGKPHILNNDTHLSISHTPEFAAAIISKNKYIGIDLELVNPKVEKIKHKFLTTQEITAINEDEKIEKLILYWSAKEALYKLHAQGGIDFKTQLVIQPFELQLSGELNADILATDLHLKNLKIQYQFFKDHVLTYVIAPII